MKLIRYVLRYVENHLCFGLMVARFVLPVNEQKPHSRVILRHSRILDKKHLLIGTMYTLFLSPYFIKDNTLLSFTTAERYL